MLYFNCDYLQGAHPALLEKLMQTNMVAQPGYGADEYTLSAKQKIRAACDVEDADVYFLCGGTQTNKVVIDSLCRLYDGVLCAETGHINAHESGAIEASGHKVLPLPQYEGKVRAEDVKNYLVNFYSDETYEHMVFPGMLYISHPTEYGTLYTKEELSNLYTVCEEYHIPLFLDGARLGYGLAAKTDVTLKDIASLTDVFYIGGTKVGALCGEAVVFTKNNCPDHFLTLIKRNGALFAKGRVVGVQFDALFTDDLYMKISTHAIKMADKLKAILGSKGYKFHINSPTNQIFVVVENEKMEKLSQNVVFSVWEKPDPSHTVIRFATSWATTEQDIDALEKLL